MSKLFLLFLSGCLFSSCNPYFVRSIFLNDPSVKMERTMPLRQVKNGTIRPLSVAANYNQSDIPDSLWYLLKKSRTVAFLVLKEDSLLCEWYATGYSDSSLTNPFSVTKSIVSILTGVALKEGKIKSLEEPVCHYYAPYRKEGLSTITFKDLLRMSSGVNYRDNLNPAGGTARIYYGNNIPKLINSFKVVKPPGTEFRYKNCDPEILTLALQNAVGMNMSDYASQKLWQPIGAAHAAKWSIDNRKDGVERTYCCFHSDARDLSRIGMLYEHKGNWFGRQIVDTSFVTASLTPHNLPQENGKLQTHNGYLWWLRNVDGLGDFAADGLKGQYVSVIPSKHLIFVRLGKRDWLKHGQRFKELGGKSFYSNMVRQVVKTWGS